MKNVAGGRKLFFTSVFVQVMCLIYPKIIDINEKIRYI
jgi:hypothetical protein